MMSASEYTRDGELAAKPFQIYYECFGTYLPNLGGPIRTNSLELQLVLAATDLIGTPFTSPPISCLKCESQWAGERML